MMSKQAKKSTVGEDGLPDLSPKDTLFVSEYIQRFNGTESAIVAGHSPRSARTAAYRLLKNDDIQAHIRARLAESAAAADEVLRKLTDQARASMADFIEVNADGLPTLNFTQAKTLGKLHVVKKFKHVREIREFGETSITKDTYEIELHDAQTALTLLGKHHRLFDRAGEIDWRSVLEAAGLNPDEQLESLTDNFIRHLRSGVQGDASRSDDAGAPAGSVGAAGS